MPVIYQYFNVHAFLKDDFAERKQRNPHYSLRAMADRIKVNSTTIIRIMNGTRNISSNMLPIFINYLGLRHKESEYFTHLVQFCKAKSEKNRYDSYRVLISIRNEMTRTIPSDRYEFYEEWYYTAVRELLRIFCFDGDFKNLGNQLNPPITSHEAKRAVELLGNLGFIDASTHQVCEKNITTGEKWNGAAIKTYQQHMLKKAVDAMDLFPKDERDFSTMSMCYSEEGLKKVKELLRNTRDELTRIEESDINANRVYQINIQAFPLTNTIPRSHL